MTSFKIISYTLYFNLLIILVIAGDFLENYIPINLMIALILYFIINLACLTKDIIQRDQIKLLLSKATSFGVLLILGYADLYFKLSRNNSHFFKNDKILTAIDSVYFSITTLTTTGYGDIYPISNSAKVFVASEMIFGYILSSLLIAILVIKFIDADN